MQYIRTRIPASESVPWSSEDESVLLASLADSWRVDNGCHFFDVLRDYLIEKFLVAVLKGRQVDELVEVRCAAVEVGEHSARLLVASEDRGRQKTVNSKNLSLFKSEGCALKESPTTTLNSAHISNLI